MKYCDMHCDALTQQGVLQVTGERLRRGGCYIQCFAAFVSARTGRKEQALRLIDDFYALSQREGFHPVTRASELKEGINAILTIEDGGAIEGEMKNLDLFSSRGVKMIGLTWNYPNEIGYPSICDLEGLYTGRSSLKDREQSCGLTPFGHNVVERMKELKMLVDVSHGSDTMVHDVAAHKTPFVASHSGARAAYDCARNLGDGEIKAIANLGGVIGLDFCADFLSDDKTAKEQEEALLRHARAIVRAGGEDCLAIGSDFDGMDENPYLKNPADMPKFLSLLSREFSPRAAEKFAYKNFLRVFQEVCG